MNIAAHSRYEVSTSLEIITNIEKIFKNTQIEICRIPRGKADESDV